MKATLLAALLLLAGSAAAQTKSNPERVAAMRTPIVKGVLALDAKNGFRTYQFGTPIDKIPGLHKIYAPQFEGNVFEKPNEPMGIGPVHLTSLWFIGIKGRLGSVMFKCYGRANAENLLAVLRQQYGPGLEYSEEHISWPGKRVTMDYTLTGDDEECTVLLVSNASAKAHAGLANDAEIKKGTSDL